VSIHLTTDETPMRPANQVSGVLLSSSNAKMQRVYQLAEGVAATPATVLMTGQSGTGKEVLARFIHQQSPRAEQPLVALNCGAVPLSLVESELFGHERGAFSGAVERRVGRIEAAEHGTLLLDEISEMPLEMQTRLLRVLQEREIHRVGSSTPIPVDVRFIATSNRDLRHMVRQGTFREDLFYRLNVFPLHVLPLQERLEDLPELVNAILGKLCRHFGRSLASVTARALSRLSQWSWPGNIRELNNVLERALIISPHRYIDAQHIVLDVDVPSMRDEPCNEVSAITQSSGRLRDLEQETIIRILSECDGNRTHAAELLGISVRTLRNRLKTYRELGVAVPKPSRGVASVGFPSSAHLHGDHNSRCMEG
jgi:DNA-binding NtrC family response regulator